FDNNGDIVVSDAKSNELVRLGLDGSILARYKLGQASAPGGIPYIVGASADTTYVFSASDNTITGFVEGNSVAHLPLDPADATKQLRYVAAGDDDIWVKSIDPESGATVARYNRNGTRVGTTSLDGPYWAHAGVLRATGDTVLSIRGYQPVVDVIDMTGRVDSLRLRGFDSPMLARMRLFQLGDAKSPPLLVPSA